MTDSNSPRAEQLARAAMIALVCSIPVLACLRGAGASVTDADLGWQMTAGMWILHHRALPHTDPFSTMHGAPWQAYSWLYDILLAKLYSWWKLVGIVAYTAGFVALITAAVYRMVSRLTPDFLQRAILTIAPLICMSRLYTPRPWLITILLFVLEIDILMQARRTGRIRELLWLPPIFALWANIHIQFIDGLLVLFVAAAEPILARWWQSDARPPGWRPMVAVTGACILATFLNPYGPGIYRIAWGLASQSGVLNTVEEMKAMPFRTISDYVVLFLALTASGVLFRYRKFPPFETLMLAMAAVLSFRSERDLWFMAITAAAILAAGLPASDRTRMPRRLPAWALSITLVLTAAIALAGASLWNVRQQHLQTILARSMPVNAVVAIRADDYSGPVFNDYNWGGFLIWKLGDPVTIDGRADFYGDARLDRSIKTWSGQPGWDSDPGLRSASIVIAPEKAALTQLLRVDPKFTLVYQDKLAAVFVPRYR